MSAAALAPRWPAADAATEDVGGQLYLNSIEMRKMNGSIAARQSHAALLSPLIPALHHYNPCSNLGKCIYVCLFVSLKVKCCSADGRWQQMRSTSPLHFNPSRFYPPHHIKDGWNQSYLRIRTAGLQQTYSCGAIICRLGSDPGVLLCFWNSD